MIAEFTDIWVYLRTGPLLWLTVTLAAYVVAQWLYERAGLNPLLNPVAIAVVLLAALLTATATEYQTYFEGAQFVHFLLGPATIALAVPLYKNFGKVRAVVVPMLVALVAGAVTAVVTALGVAALFGASFETLASLAPKSVTTPIAMGISEQIGGLPSLTAVLVILTGILGAMLATPILNLLGITDWKARGFAAGVAAHGIGTARAFHVSEVAGTFAGIAMGLNGLLTAFIVPLLIDWIR